MKIVAFDLSLTCSGWCDGERTGTLVPPTGLDRGMERLGWIRGRVLERIAGSALVVIEGYSFGAKGNAVINLGELGGVIRWTLWDRGYTYLEVPPASLKMFATGKGNAKKDEVLAAAIRQLGYMGHSHDEADAMWLHRMASIHYNVPSLFCANETQKKALAKIAWPKLTPTKAP